MFRRSLQALPLSTKAQHRPPRASQSPDPRQGGTSVPCGEESVPASQGALSKAVKEHGAAVYAIRPGQPGVGTQAKSVFMRLISPKRRGLGNKTAISSLKIGSLTAD